MSNDVSQLMRYELFPSPVWACQLEDFANHDRAMLNYVLELYERDPGLKRSNVLGWHSPDQLHHELAFVPLQRQVEALIHGTVAQDLQLDLTSERYRIRTMWAIISPPFAHNHLHRHPGSLFSGVYYLQIPPGAGALNFHDPRADVRMLRPRFAKDTPFSNFLVRFEPTPSRLLLFPSWLPHNVDPNLGEQPRISISFDIEGYAVA